MKMQHKTEDKITLDRREALKTLSLITGYTFTAGATSAFLAGCKAEPGKAITATASSALNADQLAIITEVCERILPKTETIGAKDAGVPAYIDNAISQVYKKEDAKKFIDALSKFDDVARDKFKNKFTAITDDKKDEVLNILAKEWKANKDKDGYYSVFKEMRDLTITGFTTSEVGAKQFFVYDPVPGPYQGCIPYDKKGAYAL
jgi:hypothetical protein